MIALRHVTKRFGDRVALDDISLTVEPGHTHVLLGSSGAGKSTILKIVLGLLKPDAGDVSIDTDRGAGGPMAHIAVEAAWLVLRIRLGITRAPLIQIPAAPSLDITSGGTP